MKRINDTVEEAKIREQLEAKGIKGISPATALQIPREAIEPLVVEGKSDKEIAAIHNISPSAAFYLRKFYGLPGAREVKKMLACVSDDGDGCDYEDRDECGRDELIDDGTTTEVEEATVEVVKKEEPPCPADCKGIATQEEPADPPLLDIENQAAIITPLLQGIAKYLERLGKEKVQVTVVVRKV